MQSRMISLFFYWIKERHKIYLKKENEEDWPWTKDKILQQYKFTNPYRENDRVTKALRFRVSNNDGEFFIFTKIIIFRMFNWPLTYDNLNLCGLVKEWNTKKAIKQLKSYQKEGNKIFTGAYMMTGIGSSGQGGKIILVCKAIESVLKNKESIIQNMKDYNTLKTACKILSDYPMIGNFIAYELVTDLRHTSILNKATDIYTWANPGPGAKRGIHRILWRTKKGAKSKDQSVDYQYIMKYLMTIAQNKVNKNIEMRDIEHSLCEFDKYCRAKFNEGRLKNKYQH